ncbi:regulatory protein [Quadrisphaera granulorum]|uniref:Regulatory protein RecX n=1 Tax=Quadrisphaera granulorum TaxID=317664 RepID=A0A316A5C5_9ACTN|nr:regulatory protein RecX [Quadrisphaera granulorum]PWJ52895.1 regulatory protein [Quadrisphaera granulorum]SZE97277.1 regulatory protein [Quadrisphaera granulorum]
MLRQLTAAPRSRAQLEKKLAERGVPEEAAEQVLDRFTEVGLVDDAAYAEVLVRSQRLTRGLGRRGLAHELRAKGVDDATAAAALEQVDDDAEEATARDLVARRIRSMSGLAPEVKTRRLAGMLARKGYPQGLVMRVVREAVRSESDGLGSDGLESDHDEQFELED